MRGTDVRVGILYKLQTTTSAGEVKDVATFICISKRITKDKLLTSWLLYHNEFVTFVTSAVENCVSWDLKEL